MRNLIFLIVFTLKAFIIKSTSEDEHLLNSMTSLPKKELFKVFHRFHKKEYSLNSPEGLKRYGIFKQNIKWNQNKNKELGKEVYGITPFTDLTHDEFISNFLLKPELMQEPLSELSLQSSNFLSSKRERFIDSSYYEYFKAKKRFSFDDYIDEEEEAEEAKNLNKNGTNYVNWIPYLNKPKTQGRCGSCWAFAAIGAIEGNFNLNFNKLSDFSEQYLVDCDDTNRACGGGNIGNALRWIQGNGIIMQGDLSYKASKQSCDSNLKSKEIKVLSGYTSYYEKRPINEWYNLLVKGPIVVMMDATSEGFGNFRPKGDFEWVPGKCNVTNHFVVAVGFEEEMNGERYLRIRDSWGRFWGNEGYFKVRESNNCLIMRMGFLPIVRNASIPEPVPDPVQPDCLELYPFCGFRGEKRLVCDSLKDTESNGNNPFFSLRFSKNFNVKLTGFSRRDCLGESFNLNSDIECSADANGNSRGLSSFAFEKVEKGCVLFYSDTCFAGNPLYKVCGNIADLSSLGSFTNVRSFIADADAFDWIVFHQTPNFIGNSFSVSVKDRIFNVNDNKDGYSQLRSLLNRVRSISFRKLNSNK